MMGLADALDALPPNPIGDGCKIARLPLNDEDRAVLEGWLASRRGQPGHKSNARIALALRIEGHQVSESLVQDHRAGTCACYGTC